MSLYKKIFRLIFVLMLIAITLFFYRELKQSWETLELQNIKTRPVWLMISLVLVVSSYLLITRIFRYGINCHPAGTNMSMMESVAVVSTSQLTKYLPGKIWSYALQMAMMAGRGVPASYTLFLNVLIMFSILFSASVIGTFYIMVYIRDIPMAVSIPLFVLSVLFYAVFVFFNGRTFRKALKGVNNVFHKDFIFVEMPVKSLIWIQTVVLLSNMLFGLSGYTAILGINYCLPVNMVFPISAAVLFSDLLGFVVIIAPGGLGVREGALYFLLAGVSGKQTALLLPLVLRIVTMASDLILGLAGLVLLKKGRFIRN